jgi:DNA polymerase-3 subunit delta
MQLRPEQLVAHLAKGLGPLYVVYGDEPLLAIEAGDAIRAAARAAGCEEREVLVAEQGFKWDAFSAASRNLGLFGTRKLVDLRIPNGKPGVEGARVLEDCAAHPAPDTTILITLPRLDRAASSSAWFAALEQGGVTVEVYPLERADLPRWIASRLERQQQRATAETLQFLADTTEGNLLAARQELEKIGLLLPQGELDPAAVEDAVADVARFDVFQLSEAWLAGDAARACRILTSLENEGEGVPLLLRQLGEDIHAPGRGACGQSFRHAGRHRGEECRVWGRRQAAMERAARRIPPSAIRRCSRVVSRAWTRSPRASAAAAFRDELRDVAVTLAGRPALAAS